MSSVAKISGASFGVVGGLFLVNLRAEQISFDELHHALTAALLEVAEARGGARLLGITRSRYSDLRRRAAGQAIHALQSGNSTVGGLFLVDLRADHMPFDELH